MDKKSFETFLRGIYLPLFIIAADQVTKYLAAMRLKGQTQMPEIILGVLGLNYVENSGMSFGLLQGQQVIFFAVTVLVCAFLVLVYLRIPDTKRFRPLACCVQLIFAGAVGNLIDRVKNGYVIDFLELKFISFPVFNIADLFITWPALILALLLLFRYKEEELKEIRLWRR